MFCLAATAFTTIRKLNPFKFLSIQKWIMKIWYTYTIEISLAIEKKIMEIYKTYLQFSTSLDYEEVEGDFEYTILLNRDWSYFYKKKKRQIINCFI